MTSLTHLSPKGNLPLPVFSAACQLSGWFPSDAMGIRNFEQYLKDKQLISSCSLSALSDTRLGIDLPHYLGKLLSSSSTTEPLIAAIGGLPLTLTTQIENDLRTLERLRIKPVFVCPGLPLARKPPVRGIIGPQEEHELRVKKEAWDHYENGRTEAAVNMLKETAWTEQRDLFRLVLRIFRHRNVEFLVAPYLTWSQLIYLQRNSKGYIHSVYASSEALLFPNQLDKLILSIDLSAATMSFVTKEAIMRDLKLNSEEQFLDIGILAGSDLSPTFPPLAQHQHQHHHQNLNPWKQIVEMVKHYKTGALAIQNCANEPSIKETQYADTFLRSKYAVKYSLILIAHDSICLPLPLGLPPPSPQLTITGADIPSDLHDIFSNRLPDEVYFHICRGLVSPQLIGWLTSGMIIELPPLDNGESTEYKRFVKEVITDGPTAPRCVALGLVSSVLNPIFWPSKKVVAYYYYSTPQPGQPLPSYPVPHSGPQTISFIERCLTWHVPCQVVEEELRRQNSSTIDFKLCLGATSDDVLAARTRTLKGENPSDKKPLEKKDEIVANVVWRFLDLRGFLTPAHTHAAMAQALYAGCEQTKINDKFQEPLFLALELTRAGVLHGDLLSGRAWSGGPSFGTDSEKSSMLLIMRVLSIVPLSLKTQQWTGPLSRELLVFNSFLKSLTRSLHLLLQAISVHMLLRNDARRHRDDLLDIALSLPFQSDANTGFGILAKVYLDVVMSVNDGKSIKAGEENSDQAKEAKEAALDTIDDTFIGIKSPKAEVERGFRFWDVLLIAIRTLSKNQAGKGPQSIDIQDSVVAQFEAADAWLKPMRL